MNNTIETVPLSWYRKPDQTAPRPPSHSKVILYYRKHVYGTELEYVRDEGDRKIISQLTGRTSINGQIRELLRDLSGGRIQWQEVTMPNS